MKDWINDLLFALSRLAQEDPYFILLLALALWVCMSLILADIVITVMAFL